MGSGSVCAGGDRGRRRPPNGRWRERCGGDARQLGERRQGSRCRFDQSSRLRAIGGEACVVVPKGVELCLEPDAELALTDLESAHRRVTLTSGRVTAKLEKQPPGARFSVITAAGEVTAIGTVFIVELTPDGPALVEVEEGTVEVRSPRVPTLRVHAHEKLEIGSTRVLSRRDDAVIPPREADSAPRSAVAEPSQGHAVEVPSGLPPSERVLAPSERIRTPMPAEKLPTAAERLASARGLRARGMRPLRRVSTEHCSGCIRTAGRQRPRMSRSVSSS